MTFRGSRNNSMGRGLPTAAQAAEGTQNVLEHDNDESIEALSNKIVALKSLAIDIGDEVGQQNRMLDGMETEFTGAGGLLKGTMRKLDKMISTGGNKSVCMVTLFALFVFFILYMLMKWGTRNDSDPVK